MKKAEVVKHFGSENKVAKALGLRRQAVNQWRGELVPLKQAFRLAEITKRKKRPLVLNLRDYL